MIASLLVALLASGTAAWAQEVVDGLTYSGDGVDVTSIEADIEFGEVVLSIESMEGGTLTITLDSAILGLVEGDFAAVVDGQTVEFTTTTTDSMAEIVVDIPAGSAMVVLSGLEDALVVATSPAPTEDETMTDETMTDETMTDETMTDETMTDETMTDETMTDETMTDETMTDETMTDEIEISMVADFVEPGVDIAVYVNRYLHDDGFRSWYDEWHTTMAIHESLGITQSEYQAIVDDLTGAVECPSGTELTDGQCLSVCGPGTVLEDGMCVADSRTAGMSASDADGFRAQGEGLQLGVAAAAGFGGAVGVVLLLWLPSRVRKRWLNRQRTVEE